MLDAQFDGDVLVLRPDGPITSDDIAALTQTVDGYLSQHPKVSGVMVETKAFPGYGSLAAFADHVRFVADHHARVRRVAMVTDSPLAPFAEFVANHVVGVAMRHFSFGEGPAALAWLRSA
jgi:hypothetical protein